MKPPRWPVLPLRWRMWQKIDCVWSQIWKIDVSDRKRAKRIARRTRYPEKVRAWNRIQYHLARTKRRFNAPSGDRWKPAPHPPPLIDWQG